MVFFVLGWMSVCFRVQRSADERIRRAEAEHAGEVARIRQQIYGANFFHQKGISPEDDARLERFDPTTSKGSIAISYIGGLGGADAHIQINADGSVFVIHHGVSRKVRSLDQSRCAEFFRRVLTSGILNYSDEIVELKLDLTNPNPGGGVMDAPMTEFRISVPELNIDKKFAICSPQSELRHCPDMIEFRLVVALEEEVHSFVPEGDPFWK